MKHLRYCMYEASECVKGHPQKIMEALGISYQIATPQSVADQWWFWGCDNVPDVLPPFLSELKNGPMDCIGLGLTKEEAEKIRGGASKPIMGAPRHYANPTLDGLTFCGKDTRSVRFMLPYSGSHEEEVDCPECIECYNSMRA